MRLIPALLLGLLLATAPASNQAMAAEWRAVDGDTLAHGAERWRLNGIDAPERRQACRDAQGASWACGAASQARLAQIIEGRAVECQRLDTDRYGRAVGRCWAIEADGSRIDVQSRLTAEGLALAYLKYSWRYAPEQAWAWLLGRGMWVAPLGGLFIGLWGEGDFQRPDEFRHRGRTTK
jgi:endonuclease YncB( thermonuclease family)